jgi:lipoprotein NlpI
VRDASKSIELNPRLAWAYVSRGAARLYKGEFRTAVDDYNQALELDAKNATTYRLRGDSELCSDQYKTAISDYGRALSLDPKDERSYFGRAVSEEAEDSLNSALSDFVCCDRLAEDSDTHTAAHLAIWVVRSLQGQSKQASEELSAHFSNLSSDKDPGWFKAIGDFILDTTNETDLLTAAVSSNGTIRKERLCDSYYYIGVKCLLTADQVRAVGYFGKCLSTEATYRSSYVLAKAKLAKKNW